MAKNTKNSTKKNTQANKVEGKNKESKVIGIVLIILSIYTAFAFSTGTPSFVETLFGKIIATFIFGNTTILFSVYGIVIGGLMCANRLADFRTVIIWIGAGLLTITVAFSINIMNLVNYTIVELFPLAMTGGTGGFVGILIAYLSITIIGKLATTIIINLLFITEIFFIFKVIFPEIYEVFKENKFGLTQAKDKVDQLKQSKEINEKRKQAEKKMMEDSLNDENYDELFNRTDTGQVSVDTQYLHVKDVAEELNKVDEKELSPNKTQNLTNAADNHTKDEFESLDIYTTENKEYTIPNVVLLNPGIKKGGNKKSDIVKKAKIIEETLRNFGVAAKIVGVDVGPSIARFEVQPDPGVKVNKIVNLSDDLALSLATSGIRIEAPIPGKAAVGIEVPNEDSEIVTLREIVETPIFQKTKAILPFALGKTLSGQNIIGDISKMPHMLIAGATGSGKSVCINTIIMSLLYKLTPEELKFIMIDPKMVELNQYNNIPHLLIPVVTDPKKAAYALNWGIKEMTDRYQLFSDAMCRDLEGYNKQMEKMGKPKLPRIVIIVDELADLMMTSPKEVENAICRIAQLARACGIHLVIATQRPSVDVITGLIKANIPSRIAFAVASNTDSRTILDMVGAEKLLGKGDMLYFPTGKSKPIRVQCTYVSDEEIGRVIDSIKGNNQPRFNPQIEETITQFQDKIQTEETEDALFPQAVEVALTYEQISTSMIQRKLKVGYARAGRIIDELEAKGIISGPNGSKPRTLLITRKEYMSSN